MPINRSMPPGSIIPEIPYPNLDEAVSWLSKAFGFKERLRIADHRSQLCFGDGSLVVLGQPVSREAGSAGAGQERENACGHSVMVHVEDVDRHYEQAVRCGARVINPLADYPFGERQYTVEDFAGHRWTFSQSIADVDPRDWGGVPVEDAG